MVKIKTASNSEAKYFDIDAIDIDDSFLCSFINYDYESGHRTLYIGPNSKVQKQLENMPEMSLTDWHSLKHFANMYNDQIHHLSVDHLTELREMLDAYKALKPMLDQMNHPNTVQAFQQFLFMAKMAEE